VEGHVVRARVIKTGKNNGIKNGKKYLKTRPRGGGLVAQKHTGIY